MFARTQSCLALAVNLRQASVTCEERTPTEELCPLRNFVNFIWHRKAQIISGSAIFTQLGLHLVRKYLRKQEQAILWASCFHLLPRVSFVWIPLKMDYITCELKETLSSLSWLYSVFYQSSKSQIRTDTNGNIIHDHYCLWADTIYNWWSICGSKKCFLNKRWCRYGAPKKVPLIHPSRKSMSHDLLQVLALLSILSTASFIPPSSCPTDSVRVSTEVLYNLTLGPQMGHLWLGRGNASVNRAGLDPSGSCFQILRGASLPMYLGRTIKYLYSPGSPEPLLIH